jgi:hypothetical protein
VPQVGFIACIYRDAWSTKHKKAKVFDENSMKEERV